MTDDISIFQTGISVLFNEPEINIGDPFDNKHTLQFNDQEPIELLVPNPMKFSLFAHHIWKASILLSRILLKEPKLVNGKSVLELGAGAGIPSIISSRLGGVVTCTDYPDDNIIKALKKNAPLCKVVGHEWGSLNITDKYDIILMADTIWDTKQHDNLYKDFINLLRPNGKVIGVAGLHSGKSSFDSFFKLSSSYGFKVTELTSFRIPIGNGFCENHDWMKDENVDYSKEKRSNFLFKFIIEYN
jgi:nicotinamide N-methyltransferase